MRPAGLAEITLARDDGRWDQPMPASAPRLYRRAQRELDADPDAAAAFSQLDTQHRYSIIWRINDRRRPETRSRRVAKYLEMLRRGERIH